MYIRKITEGSGIPNNAVLDGYSTSQTDAYSCNYLNDSVIESITNGGTNPNTYKIMKYSNGLMIVVGTQTFNNVSFNTDWWGKFNRADTAPVINLPITFNSILFFKIGTDGSSVNNNIMIVDGNTRISDNNKITCYLVNPKDNVGNRNVILNYFLIGTWK